MPTSRPVRVVTGCNNSMPVRIVTAGGDPVRIVTEGISDPVRVVTSGLSTPVVVISGSTPPTPPTPPGPDAPTFVSAEVGNVDGQTVVVVFSVAITANGGDYGVGFTILVNAAPNAVTAFNHSAGDTIQLTLTTCVNYGDTVTIAYDDSVGQIHESTGVTAMVTFGAQAVTNNVAWYRTGCAPAPVAAYLAKGAASYVASKINLVNPGTYDAVDGVAFPTWAGATGWTFNGTTQYLTTGVIPQSGWSAFVQFTGLSNDNSCIFGENNAAKSMDLHPRYGASQSYFDNGQQIGIATAYTSGNVGVAGQNAYYNGSVIGGAIGAWVGVNTLDVYIGALNLSGSVNRWSNATIQAVVIYSSVLTGPMITAVVAAMALL